MNPNDNKESYYAGFLFLLWPFLALVSAFRNYRKPWAKNILWAFIAFYGFTFGVVEGSRADIVRYIASFQDWYTESVSLVGAVEYFWASRNLDILNLTIQITVSRFTDNPAMLTLAYATVFGFFFSRNMWYILDRMQGNMLLITVLLFICFFFIVPIWNINGFRMWTATHVFLYGMLPYLFENRKDKIWIACSSVLVHFSFIIPVFIFIGYMIAGNWLTVYFGIFIVSFFISEIDLGVINTYVEAYTPERFQERTETYRQEGPELEGMPVAEEGFQRNWYMRWYQRGLRWAIAGYMIAIFLSSGRKFIKERPGMHNLFCFSLLFFGFANMVSSLPSLGRFLSVASLFAMALIIFYVQYRHDDKIIQRAVLVSLPALFLFILVSIRVGLLSVSATSILGNPIIALFTAGENISLEAFLRMLL